MSAPSTTSGAAPAAMSTVRAADADEWRAWLQRNSSSEREIWLIIQHADSPEPSVRYGEAIEQALCYGWIDSHHRTHDQHSSALRFSPRTRRSNWSAINQRRAADLIERGLMTESGYAAIQQAKDTGRWRD